MVERLNRSLLQMLRSYVDTKEDWEQYLPLVLYAYRTAIHSSTSVSPFQLMYGREPKFTAFSDSTAFDATTYQGHLQAKLAELRDFVQANLSEAATRQRTEFNKHCESVWLSIPTAGKLDPRWEGKWIIKSIKSPVTFEIADGKRCKVVHVNRLRRRISESSGRMNEVASWNPPQTDHLVVSDAEPSLDASEMQSPQSQAPPSPVTRHYPSRTRNPPDWFHKA